MNETEQQPENPSTTMIFTLEDDNDAAPTYENQTSNWEESLNAIRNRYRRSEEILAAHRAKLAGAPSPDDDDVDDAANASHMDDVATSDLPESDSEQEFRLPEIDMPEADREYSLDDIDHDASADDTHLDDADDGETDTEHESASVLITDQHRQEPNVPLKPKTDAHEEEDEAALSKLFKRYQEEREQSPIQPKPKPIFPAFTQPESELAQGYAAYLNHRQSQHNQRIKQGVIAEEDIGILLQEDWVAAQSALKIGEQSAKTLHLQAQANEESEMVYQEHPVDEPLPNLPTITVHVYDLPELPSTRQIKILSEKELVAELQQKLRPHLSNAVAGLMHHVLQKKLATLSYDLQMMLNEETPRLVEDVLAHNMDLIVREIKEKL